MSGDDIEDLKNALAAQRLANDALAEKLRAVTIERDRYFAMKRYNAGRFAEKRNELQELRHEARKLINDGPPLGIVDAMVNMIKRIADG